MYNRPEHYFLISDKKDFSNEISVKKSFKINIFDEEIEFNIIGESHLIKGKNFQEVFSAINFENSEYVNFIDDKKKQLQYENNKFIFDVEIEIFEFSKDIEFCKRFFNLFFDFNEGGKDEAFTGIDIDEDGWKTIHTYKEFGKVVFTKTSLTLK